MKKKRLIVIFALILILIITCLCVKSYNDASHIFSVSRWAQHPEQRLKMINSLVEQYGIIGMSRGEVIELLGTKDIWNNNGISIAYFVASGIGDPVVFEVYFNEDGIVESYNIYEH